MRWDHPNGTTWHPAVVKALLRGLSALIQAALPAHVPGTRVTTAPGPSRTCPPGKVVLIATPYGGYGTSCRRVPTRAFQDTGERVTRRTVVLGVRPATSCRERRPARAWPVMASSSASACFRSQARRSPAPDPTPLAAQPVSFVPLSVLGCMPKWLTLAGCDVLEGDVLGITLACGAVSRCVQQDDARHCLCERVCAYG